MVGQLVLQPRAAGLSGHGRDGERSHRDAELEWSDDRKLRFIAQNVVDATAPANAPLINPYVRRTEA
jgi:hypothetical protein